MIDEQRLRDHPSFALGKAAAKSDIAVDKLAIRMHGWVDSLWPEVAQLLQERYDISCAVVDASITDVEAAAETAGYNARMASEFKLRFGGNVMYSTRRDVLKKKKTTTERAILYKIWCELEIDRTETERNIKQSLRYYKCGPYDQERVDLLRVLRDRLMDEFCKRERSQYYLGGDVCTYSELRHFDIARMIDDFHALFPNIAKTEFEYIVPQMQIYYDR